MGTACEWCGALIALPDQEDDFCSTVCADAWADNDMALSVLAALVAHRPVAEENSIPCLDEGVA